MISSLEGKIEFAAEKFIILNVNGVGFKVFVAAETLSKIQQKGDDVNPSTKLRIDGEQGRTIKLYTDLVIRDNGADLYGFLTVEELQFFELLDSVAGVGPKGALGILGVAKISEIKNSIIRDDAELLTKVSGIGKKTAERITLELKSKLKGKDFESAFKEGDAEVIEALTGMGYSLKEVRNALREIPENVSGIENRAKEALKLLGRTRR